VTQSDPTDNALAAIASILDNPETPQPPPLPREAAKPVAEKPEEKPLAPEQIEADGYCKVGPGPIASIEDGEFYIDETVGESSAPVTSGPMSRDAAIKFIDDRESDARQRFESLRSEMAGRTAVADLFRKDSSEL